jgi:YHS domain-containing protein
VAVVLIRWTDRLFCFGVVLMHRLLVFAAIFGLAVAVPGAADEKKAEGQAKKEFKATCPVSGKDAVRDQSVAYKEKKVYFCCGNCKAAYEKEPEKFTGKANWQLVQTRQFVQTKCPLSGGDVDKKKSVEVGGVKVAFCCDMCKGKASAATGDDQVAMVFADGPFAKAFEARTPGEGKKKQAK